MSIISIRFPGGRAKALTFSYDDNVEQDARLIDIFDKYGLKGTFNLSSGLFAPEGNEFPAGYLHREVTKKAALEIYKNHEVATHGYTHPFLDRLEDGAAAYEIIKDREVLEEMFGRIIRGHAYAYGAYNERSVEILRSCGIAYARKIETTGDFLLPKDWLQLEGTCHHEDERLMDLAERFVKDEPRLFRSSFVDPWLFYVWGHSFEFELRDNWDRMEKFCAYVSGRDDVWYATNIEIYDYCQAFNRLQFSADGRRVFNPSAQTVHFMLLKRGNFAVKPGECLQLW